MLTCTVGKQIIDTFTYKDEKLREWSNKGMLKCPVCGEKMLYCHGDFKIPYFRHEKNSDCPDIYSEGITEEHINGIKILYDWLNKQEGISDIQLEKWIPETRQRPDIYFKYNGEEYVIEYQCSPIATKYNERHDLYKLNNINDIWILGVNKYGINNISKERSIYYKSKNEVKTKTIEQQIFNGGQNLVYLNEKLSRFYITNNKYSMYAKRTRGRYVAYEVSLNTIIDMKLFAYNSNDIIINKILKQNFDDYIYDDYFLNNTVQNERDYLYKLISNDVNFDIIKTSGKKNYKITYKSQITDDVYNIEYTYKNGDIEGFDRHCNINFEGQSIVFYNENISLSDVFLYNNKVLSHKLEEKRFNNIIKEYCDSNKRDLLRTQQNIYENALKRHKVNLFKEKNREILNLNIYIVDGRKKLDENIRFKMLKDFSFNETYYLNDFIKEIYWISKFKNKDNYFMIPKYKCDTGYIFESEIKEFINILKKYGFSNIAYLT